MTCRSGSTVMLAVQMLSALAMIGLVLIQHGKGADMGASFGSGASGSLFGATGSANFLSRSTAVCAAVFFVCTLALAFMSADGAGARPVRRQRARTRRPRPRSAGSSVARRPAAVIPGAAIPGAATPAAPSRLGAAPRPCSHAAARPAQQRAWMLPPARDALRASEHARIVRLFGGLSSSRPQGRSGSPDRP